MGKGGLLQHCEQPHHVGLALVSRSRQDPFRTYIVLDLCDILASILMYLFLLALASNTAIAASTASLKLLSSSLSHSTARTALVIARILRVRCSCSNSVAHSEVRGIVSEEG